MLHLLVYITACISTHALTVLQYTNVTTAPSTVTCDDTEGCNIICSGLNACSAATINAQSSSKLILHSSGETSLSNAIINCPDNGECYITIDGYYGASEATINCGVNTECEVIARAARALYDVEIKAETSTTLTVTADGGRKTLNSWVRCPRNQPAGSDPQCIIQLRSDSSPYFESAPIVRWTYFYVDKISDIEFQCDADSNWAALFDAKASAPNIIYYYSDESDSKCYMEINYDSTDFFTTNQFGCYNGTDTTILDGKQCVPWVTHAPTTTGPTMFPTESPTEPTVSPTTPPTTAEPTVSPTESSVSPTEPSVSPTIPSVQPSYSPTVYQTLYPTLYSLYPTLYPSKVPTSYPTLYPTLYQTLYPTLYPTIPSVEPSYSPTKDPIILETSTSQRSKSIIESISGDAYISVIAICIVVSVCCCCIVVICILYRKRHRKVYKKNMDAHMTETVQLSKTDHDLGTISKADGEKEEMKQWLQHSVGLPQYYPLFLKNGYECMKFIKGMEDKSQLKEMGITKLGHQTILWSQIKQLQLMDSTSTTETPGITTNEYQPGAGMKRDSEWGANIGLPSSQSQILLGVIGEEGEGGFQNTQQQIAIENRKSNSEELYVKGDPDFVTKGFIQD